MPAGVRIECPEEWRRGGQIPVILRADGEDRNRDDDSLLGRGELCGFGERDAQRSDQE